jgi:putative membrane protein insertion efficiency factor
MSEAAEVAGGAGRPCGVARLLAGLVRGYQLAISPLLRPSCRFAPSCSEYAYESLVEHGALRGSWLAVRRLLRCHPFCTGGYDPVPPSKRRSRGTRSRDERVEAGDAAAVAIGAAEPALVPALTSQEAGECPC